MKAHHQISPAPKMDQVQMLLTSAILTYDLPCLNIKAPEKILNRRILDKESGPIYGSLTNIDAHVKNHDTEFYRKEKKFQLLQ